MHIVDNVLPQRFAVFDVKRDDDVEMNLFFFSIGIETMHLNDAFMRHHQLAHVLTHFHRHRVGGVVGIDTDRRNNHAMFFSTRS